MKAALIDRYGSNDAVSVADIDIPTLGATDLLVRVHAASVNPVDIKTRDGKLKTLLKYRFPLVLGNDLSGVVSDVGSRVTEPNWNVRGSRGSPRWRRRPQTHQRDV